MFLFHLSIKNIHSFRYLKMGAAACADKVLLFCLGLVNKYERKFYMSRDKEDYRENLRRLDEKFPDKEFLNIGQISQATGLERRIIKNTWGKNLKTFGKSQLISKVTLARLMS